MFNNCEPVANSSGTMMNSSETMANGSEPMVYNGKRIAVEISNLKLVSMDLVFVVTR